MGQIASRGQLRMAFLRWALLFVPAILLLGTASGRLAGSGYDNPWFASLAKPASLPPGWAFGVAWTALYVLMGLALALVVSARGARGRGPAIAVFALQLVLNLAWAPLFFAAHQVGPALMLIAILLFVVTVTIVLFWRVRRLAGMLLLPYLLWLAFATHLNREIDRLNPDADRLAPSRTRTQISL